MKPCARPGCVTPVTHPIPRLLAKLRYCSVKCAAQHRALKGYRPPPMTHQQRVEAGRAGGRVSGLRRRKAAALSAARAVQRLLPADLEDQLSAPDYRRILALLVRVYREGHTAGKSAARMTPKRKPYRPRIVSPCDQTGRAA